MNNDVRKQIDHSLIILIVRSLLSLIIIIGLLYLSIQLLKQQGQGWGRDAFMMLLGGFMTYFVVNGKFWFERSADYTESKNVERVNKLNEGAGPNLASEVEAVNSGMAVNLVEKYREHSEKLSARNEELMQRLNDALDEVAKLKQQPPINE